MKKIYFKKGLEATNLDELLKLLFSSHGYSVATYNDDLFIDLQCCGESRRSFEDLLCIANTYFPETTEEQLMQSIINVKLKFYYCSDIRKIVFHYSGHHTPDNGFEIQALKDVDYTQNNKTYTASMLQEIYNNLKIKENVI